MSLSVSTKERMECLLNPTKSQLLLTIQQQGATTAKELRGLLPDIPQASLYRMLKQLTNLELLEIVSEKQVRAVVEKTYGVSQTFAQSLETIIEENNGPAYFQLMASFSLQLMSQFKSYAEQPNIDILQDGSGFSATPLYASREELQELGKKINALLTEYQTKSTNSMDQQTLYSFAMIMTPALHPNSPKE